MCCIQTDELMYYIWLTLYFNFIIYVSAYQGILVIQNIMTAKNFTIKYYVILCRLPKYFSVLRFPKREFLFMQVLKCVPEKNIVKYINCDLLNLSA